MNQINIGTKIRELRKKKGITQEALAEAMSVSPQAVSKWESGLTYPGNEALLTGLIEAYEYDMRKNGSAAHLDHIIEISQKLIFESKDVERVCNAKELQALAYLKKDDYKKAKSVLESLPGSVVLKNDAIAYHLKGQDKLNGATLSRCNLLQCLYIACMEEGTAWFRMEEQNVAFRNYTPADYIPEALKAYRRGLTVLEAFLIEGKTGQDQYLRDFDLAEYAK